MKLKFIGRFINKNKRHPNHLNMSQPEALAAIVAVIEDGRKPA